MPQQSNGWYLPNNDSYFPKFCEGAPPKQNGFQREHLWKAFEYVKNWRIAIDVGAHVGFWTRDMAQKFEAVFAFEVADDTYECLVKNTSDLQNVATLKVAIGDEVGHVMVHNSGRGENSGARYVSKIGGKGGTAMMPLDKCSIPLCDLLKVDVEGFEYQVLKGAESLIEENHPVVIMECDKRFAPKRYGIDNDAAMRFLRERGYSQVWKDRPDRIFVHDKPI